MMPPAARPFELGEAYFWIDQQLVHVAPYRNHRDWLLANQARLGLSHTMHDRPNQALWIAYQQRMIRIVWDPCGKWSQGKAHSRGSALYISGFESMLWRCIKPLMNHPTWAGLINTVCLEYVRDRAGRAQWYHNQMFDGGDLESLYRGRRPRRTLIGRDAMFGGEIM
jgi:hypothetical protein